MYISRDLFAAAYQHLKHHAHGTTPSILILVALDTDALCAARILTSLLKNDYIPHKMHPVAGYKDLKKVNEEHIRGNEELRFLIVIGLGGMVQLADYLELQKDDERQVECWVIDSRRPWNLYNIFGENDQGLREGIAGCRVSGGRFGVGDKVGGIKCFDDGDIEEELEREGKAFRELLEMPVVDSDDEDEDDDDDDAESDEEDEALENGESSENAPENANGVQGNGYGRKRKSSENAEGSSDDDSEDEDGRDRSRRRKRDHRSPSDSPILHRHGLLSHPSNRPLSSSPARSARRSSPLLPSSRAPSPSLPPPLPSQRTLRKRLRRLWKKNSSIVRRYYRGGSYYGEPVSGIMYSLASDLGKEDNDLLWLAIVGVCSGEIYGRGMAPAAGDHSCMAREERIRGILKDEVRRLNPPELLPNNGGILTTNTGVIQTTAGSPNDTSIRISPEFRFMLVRHWSLYDSMLHSGYLGTKLKIWNENGRKKLHKLLAKMGFSLVQCKQRYTHMDMDLKRTLREKLEGVAGLYGIDEVVKEGFVRSWGWKACLSAGDVGVVIGGILEVGKGGAGLRIADSEPEGRVGLRGLEEERAREKAAQAKEAEEWLTRFHEAYEALENIDTLLSALPTAMTLHRAIVRTGTALIEKRQIRLLRAFRMAVVKEGPDVHLFTHPAALTKLAMWVGEAVYEQEKEENRKRHLPIVLAALNEARGVYIVVGMGSGAKIKRKKPDGEKKEDKPNSKEAKEKKKMDNGEDENEEEEEEEEEDDEDEMMIEKGYGRNKFGIAFQEVAEQTNARLRIDSFEACVVEVKRDDLPSFFESLSFKVVVG